MSGPLPAWLTPITLPGSMLYDVVTVVRNRRFDRGRGVERISRPVISIGNISAGGTGKSPMVAWLARELQSRDVRPVIAMRGYRKSSSGIVDEAAEYETLLPGVPIVAEPDRVAAVREFLQRGEADCVLLDDGFQHRRLARDLDLVLIDATRPAIDGRLLPAGWLRERADGLRRADAVIVTRAQERNGDLAALIRRYHGRDPIAWTRHAWRSLTIGRPQEGARWQSMSASTDWLAGKRVAIMLGVGNSEAVRRQIEAAGATVAADFSARDHHDYAAPEVRRFCTAHADVDAFFVTPKDWVKLWSLLPSAEWPRPVVVPVLGLEFLSGAEALMDRVMSAIAR